MDPFLGQIILFAGNFAPRGWALCEGQLLPINQNQALFSLFGTIYGGDGRTTFALPDLRGRAPISHGPGPGLSNHNIGAKGGNAVSTLLTANLPQAQIQILGSDDDSNTNEPNGQTVYALPADDKLMYHNSNAGTSLKDGSIIGAANTQFSNQPPYLALNYIVALTGVFPSRN
jgi:microcystin-dependent protein